MSRLDKVTRVEVIEKGSGRVYVRYGVEKLELSEQDEGRTLKVFVEARLARRAKTHMVKGMTPGDRAARRAASQIGKPITGTWTKRDDKTAKFMDVKADPKPFRGVRKGKGVVSRPRSR
jgi:hypothetical protein